MPIILKRQHLWSGLYLCLFQGRCRLVSTLYSRRFILRHQYTVEQVTAAVEISFSIRNVLKLLGISPAGGNYATIKKYFAVNGIDTSHFTKQGWSKGRTIGPKRDIEEYLNNNYPINSHKLRCRLLSESLLQHKCFSCGLELWLDNPISLELHHADGDSSNNSLENLQLLCPNCHSLTSNYRGKALLKS